MTGKHNIQIRLLSEYGNFYHTQKEVMQKVAYSDGVMMRKNTKRFFAKKIPIYIGHPDSWHEGAIIKNKVIGYVTDIIPLEEGIACVMEFNLTNMELDSLNLNYPEISPRWRTVKQQHITFDGKQSYHHPVSLVSVGMCKKGDANLPNSGKFFKVEK